MLYVSVLCLEMILILMLVCAVSGAAAGLLVFVFCAAFVYGWHIVRSRGASGVNE